MMEFYNIIQVNLFAFIILFLIFINIKNSSRNILFDQRLFLSLVLVTLSLLLIDIVRVFVNGKDTLFMININWVFSTLTYILTPLTSFIWYMYVDYKIHESRLRLKRRFFVLSFPLIVNIFLLILNLTRGRFFQIVFAIDRTNTYHRGPLVNFIMLIAYVYLFYALVNIVKHRAKIDIKDFYYLIAFIIPPIIAGIIQSLLYGVKLIWPSLALSIFLIYINIQNKQLYLDVLTGLYNRRKLNIYLEDILDIGKNSLIGGIMIDLDDFKSINDTFGHLEGDEALIHVANLLKNNFRREDFLARYAGDEFLIILKIHTPCEIKGIVKRLKRNIDEFNQSNITPYKLSLSLGYDVFDPNSYITSEEFVTRIDNLMYKQKESKKLPCKA